MEVWARAGAGIHSVHSRRRPAALRTLIATPLRLLVLAERTSAVRDVKREPELVRFSDNDMSS
jgi:hypothetical protein